MKIIKTKKGFTLIELLFVVAIIALVSSITLNSFSETRDQATLAVIKQEINSLRQEAEIYYAGSGSYTNTPQETNYCPEENNSVEERARWGFFGSAKGIDLINSITERSGASQRPFCSVARNSWAISLGASLVIGSNSNSIVETAHAQDSDNGYICFDSSDNIVLELSENFGSDGDFRAQKIEQVKNDEGEVEEVRCS